MWKSQSASSRRRLRASHFPLWLAPDQVRIITLNDDEKLVAYAKDIAQQLRAAEVRVTSDLGPETDQIQNRQRGTSEKVHTMLVIGGRDVEAGNVATSKERRA